MADIERMAALCMKDLDDDDVGDDDLEDDDDLLVSTMFTLPFTLLLSFIFLLSVVSFPMATLFLKCVCVCVFYAFMCLYPSPG